MSINIDNFYRIDYLPKAVIFSSGYVQHYIYMYLS